VTESMLASFRSPAGQRLVFLSPPRPLRWADARLPSRASSRTCQALARPGFSASTDRRSASMRLTTFREAASQKMASTSERKTVVSRNSVLVISLRMIRTR